MDNPNKSILGNRIRTRSSRDSSVDDLVENALKKNAQVTDEVKPALGVSTRHHTRGSGVDLENEKNVGLEFPMGRRRRKFPKIISSFVSPVDYCIDVRPKQDEDVCTGYTDTKQLENSDIQAGPHAKNGSRKKPIEKQSGNFKRRAPGQRRRSRIRVLSCNEDGAVISEPGKMSSERLVPDVSGTCDKNVEHANARPDSCSTLEGSLLDGNDISEKESVAPKSKRSGSSERRRNSTNTQNINGHEEAVLNFGSDSDCRFSQKRNRICSEGDASLPRPNHQDSDHEVIGKSNNSHGSDEHSLSGTMSIDDDSRDAAERENRPKGQSSVHGVDSDDGSIATTDSRSSTGRRRRKSGQGNLHRTSIDFRVGGRLEARDYLNMWYPSRIIQVDWDDKEVLIHFERWNSRFDEWVSMDSPRLRAITRTSTRKEKKDSPFPVAKEVGWADLMRPYNTYRSIVKSLKNEFKIGEVVLAKWTDCKMYPAKIAKINSDLSYNVFFYDGFERVVQYINIKKLPPDFVGDLNFKAIPPKADEIRKRNVSGSKKDDDAKDEPKPKLQKNKILPEREALSVEKPKSKPASASLGSSHKMNGPALPSKKRKLLVGGIFQAKRHQLEVKTSGNLSRPNQSGILDKENTDSKPSRCTKKPEPIVTDKPNEKEPETPIISPAPLLLPEVSKGNISGAANLVASKAFIIEEDHNHFKCLVEGCGKAFRKDALLASHMKHYHTVKRKPNENSKPAEKKLEIVETPQLVESPNDQLVQPVAQPIKNEGNLERKLITEKRRQLLLQKQLDKQHQAAANYHAKLNKKTLVPSEANGENSENPVKLEKPKSRKRKFFLSARGVAKLKKRKLEGVEKAKAQDGNLAKQTPGIDGTEPDTNQRLEPLSSKMFLNLKPLDDKALMAKLGKEFGVYRSGQNVTSSAWGGNSELRDEVVNCRCRLQEEDGLMMQCEVCLAWQHGACFDIEDEDKVPEKYICFACENPKGQRHSFKHKHNQDWFKLGELASFRFLPKRDTWSLKENMLKTHNLASQLLSIGSVLHSLQCKLQIAQVPKHSNLVLWSRPWQDATPSLGSHPNNYHKNKMSTKHDLSISESGQNGGWAFTDHSYSVPSRGYQQNDFADHHCTFLTEQSDDKNLCFEVAANEILDAQGMGPPLQEEVLESCLSLNTKLEMPEEHPEQSKPSEPALLPKEEPNLLNHTGEVKEEKDVNSSNAATAAPNKLDSKEKRNCNAKPAVEKSKHKECRSLHPHNSKKSITEAIDVYTCQINLLDHIEHLQEELDRRLDELNQQLEFLESDFESPSLSSSGDTLADIPRVKKLLKAMGNDLVKVQRMALYC